MQFPLNLRDWNVDCIYTTNLSAHPGHGSFNGGKSDATLIKDLFQGLKNLSLDDDYKCVIVGYIAADDILEVVWKNILTELNTKKNIIKVLDPVMGDNGKIYVNERVVSLYLQFLGENSVDIDLLTPNQFEMETLSGVKINSWESVLNALKVFCSKYTKVKNVIITSVFVEGKMYCVGASKGQVFYYDVEQIDAVFSGSGDLLLGILTDEFVKSDQDLVKSLCNTLGVVNNVLQLSYNILKNDPSLQKIINGKLYIPDLKLIESKKILTTKVPFREPSFLKR
ncbi:bud site selection protein [Pichia californica]|uniref:pyridoxal kinase n=1 Tax=Pichia californica TaxID=460514 RepID=A0A9P6WP95_9ASCO|nr:bud site selection protein [[Candida] californica]KAG0690765.1 bud site selection protein [[Candida] californica]